METRYEWITPRIAAEWLKRNTKNRGLRQRDVDRYAKQMKEGQWSTNHQGIALYETGVLADGQHRLAAIVAAKIPVYMSVTYGVPESAASDIDQNAPRTTIDAITIGNLSDWVGGKEIPIIKLVVELRDKNVAKMSAKDVVEEGEKIKGSVLLTTSLFKSNTKGVCSTPVKTAFTLAHLNGEDEVRLVDFHNILVMDGFLKDGRADSSAIKLKVKLASEQGRITSRGASYRHWLTRLSMNAIFLFCRRRPITNLVCPDNYRYKYPEGLR